MWPHFKKLLWQSWLSLVQALGTTSLAIVVAIIGFFFVLVINLIFKLRKDGWSWSVTVSHFSQNLKDSLVPTVLGTCFLWAILYGTFVVRQVYYDHHNMAGRWQDVVTEKDNLKRGLQCRDAYIKRLESRTCPTSLPRPAARIAPGSQAQPSIAPRVLSDLQMMILRRYLPAGAGWRVRINAIGKSSDTVDFADELRRLFKGWQLDGGDVGMTNSGTSSELEFVIPHPEDPSVQLAVHTFDRAHIPYTKNVSPNAYRGPLSLGSPPPLTINVTDR